MRSMVEGERAMMRSVVASASSRPALHWRAMFKKVLIANRGEIACRIMRTAKALGVRTAAAYAPDDAGALFTRLADEAHRLQGLAYLDAAQLVALAKSVGADCLHPGYGFLSENPEFAEMCAAAGIVFIGPSPEAMRALGLKHQAKALAQAGRRAGAARLFRRQSKSKIPEGEGLRNRLSRPHQGGRGRRRARHARRLRARRLRRGARGGAARGGEARSATRAC